MQGVTHSWKDVKGMSLLFNPNPFGGLEIINFDSLFVDIERKIGRLLIYDYLEKRYCFYTILIKHEKSKNVDISINTYYYK